MNHLLAARMVSPDDTVSIADALFEFHEKAVIVDDQNFGSPNFIQQHIHNDAKNLCQIFENVEPTIAMKANRVLDRLDQLILVNGNILLERQEQGYIRECHGDLRSANIFMLNGPCFFDCIEFNDEFRFTDVANDVGSLVADLSFFEQDKLIKVFVDSYVKNAPNKSLRVVLPIYVAHWGIILAQVAGHEWSQAKVEQKKQDLFWRAMKYLDVSMKALAAR